jgi:CheY-specific phosphatase CheX
VANNKEGMRYQTVGRSIYNTDIETAEEVIKEMVKKNQAKLDEIFA